MCIGVNLLGRCDSERGQGRYFRTKDYHLISLDKMMSHVLTSSLLVEKTQLGFLQGALMMKNLNFTSTFVAPLCFIALPGALQAPGFR